MQIRGVPGNKLWLGICLYGDINVFVGVFLVVVNENNAEVWMEPVSI